MKVRDNNSTEEFDRGVLDILQNVRDNHKEYGIVNLLLFNELEFDFMLLQNPAIHTFDNSTQIYLEVNGISLLKPKYGSSIFVHEPISDFYRYIEHPEHLSGYVIKYKNDICGEYFYSRGQVPLERIFENILTHFLYFTEISDIDEIDRLVERSYMLRQRHVFQNTRGAIREADVSFLNDSIFLQSMQKTARYENDTKKKVLNVLKKRILEIQESYFNSIIVMMHFDCFIIGKRPNSSLYYEAYVPQPRKSFKTNINEKICIIDKEDVISDLLYSLAVKIDAEEFCAAVGYSYDSGLEMIEPILMVTSQRTVEEGIMITPADIIVGSLQNYGKGKTIKGMNRATADKLNDLRSLGLVDLYTNPNAFYHGKFYYLSGKEKSYVIVGSSNITGPAYKKNRELDVLFSFEKRDSDPTERMFLNWYKTLINECHQIRELDCTLFSSNTDSDERGSQKGESYYRNITSDEERDRFDFLKSLHPDDFIEYPFKKNKECFPFKMYVAFVYIRANLIILEEFRYGNASYIFGTSNLSEVLSNIAKKNKSEVRRSDIIVDCVDHNERYKERISALFQREEDL